MPIPVPPGAPAEPRPAATVLLLRQPPGGRPCEVLMVRRSDRATFMPGAYVFPGGALDRADASPAMRARCRGPSPEQARQRLGGALEPEIALGLLVAGARESFEEAGVLLATDADGRDVTPDPAVLGQGRALAAAATREAPFDFAGWLAGVGLQLALDRLEMLSRWVTPEVEAKRFDTVFLVAEVPRDQAAAHDAAETVDSTWLAPAEALRLHSEGGLVLPPPTLRNLEDVAGCATVAEVLDLARRRPRRTVRPRFVALDGVWTLLLPGDPLYPSDEPIGGPSRLVLDGGRWWSRSAGG
ncbi:NUDIX hydrolase [Myxococcota bacterium]|nr:NUDIX hydrolase [Myxococcota bacterium]